MKLAFEFPILSSCFIFLIGSLHLSEAVVLLVICISFRKTFYCILGARPALAFVFII